MDETVFPPSPNWFLPKIISSREDGTLAYGSRNNIAILKTLPGGGFDTFVISNAHLPRVVAVALSPSNCNESVQNTVVSGSTDGVVKLWSIDKLSSLMAHKSHWEQRDQVGKIISLDWSLSNPHHIVSVADNNSLVLWDILSNTTVKFSFQKLAATDVSCCPYNEKIVAVGTNSGLIIVINLVGNGVILYKLRGHDNEIQSLTWCPVPYNVFRTNEVQEEFLLASACQDREIYIWRIGSDGKCEAKIHIPTNSISKKGGDQHHTKVGNSFSFSCIFWFEPYKIYTCSSFGELIYFDIKSYNRNRTLSEGMALKKVNEHSFGSFKLAHYFHSKGLFAIAGAKFQGELLLYKNVEIKSELKFKIQNNNCNISQSLHTNGSDQIRDTSDLNWDIITPTKSHLIWTAGQDKKLIACKSNSSKLEMVFNIHTLQGFVYHVVVSPHDPNKIAIAAGDGVIRLWNLTEPSGEIQMYWKKVKGWVMSLAWHPTRDGLLAYGTSEGRVGLIDTNSSKQPNVFKPSHPDPIYVLSWGPQFPFEDNKDEAPKLEFCLYAVSHNTLSMFSPSKFNSDPLNLSRIITFSCKKQTDVSWKPDYSLMAVGSEDGSISLVEPSKFKIVCTIQAYKKLIQSISWHPSSTSLDSGLSPYQGYFTSGSTDNDNEIRVFNCIKENEAVKVEKVATLKGHYGHIQAVSWSPHSGGRLISTSADCSVQIWDVITQTPLINFCDGGNKMAVLSIWSPVDPDYVITGFRDSKLRVWRISTQTRVSPQPIPKANKKKLGCELATEIAKNNIETVKKGKNNEMLNVDMAEAKPTAKHSGELKMFSKSGKGDVKDELATCYYLLKAQKTELNGRNFSLPFLCEEGMNYQDFLKSEEESYKKSNNWTEYYELSLWCGNIKQVLEDKIKTGQLNDFLVSLAPSISPRLWQEACLSYSKTLAERKMFRKAASYLIICHKIYEAVQLLMDENLYLEALCIAKGRLPKSDPVVADIIRKYGQWLFKNGSFLKASQCFIYLEDFEEVATICGRKSLPEYLSLAALAFKKCGQTDLEESEATNALLKCFETKNFELAVRICEDHDNLKHLFLLYHVFQTIHQLNSGEILIEKDIITHIIENHKLENICIPPSLHQLYHKYTFYKNKQQVLIVVAQELSFAVCSKDVETCVVHLIRALSSCNRYIQNVENEPHPLYKVCTWLSPKDILSENSYFSLKNVELLPKVKSLRAFLCAALVRNLSDNLNSENIMKNIDVLNELKDDLLDEDSYKYFKNLIEIEICEKRMMTNQNKLFKSRLTHKANSQNDEKSCKHSDSSNDNHLEITNGIETDKINEIDTFENNNHEPLHFASENKNENLSIDNVEEIEKQIAREEENSALSKMEEEHCNLDCESSRSSEKDVEFKNLETDLEEKILQDVNLLSRLKTEIKNFELKRISSPNPVPVYFMLKKLCESVSESETATGILKDIEKKWKTLN